MRSFRIIASAMALLAVVSTLVIASAHADSGSDSYELPPDTEISHIVVRYREGSGVTLRDGTLALANTNAITPDTQSQVAADLETIESIAVANNYHLQRTFDAFSETELDDMYQSVVGTSDQVFTNLNRYHSLLPSADIVYSDVEHLVDALVSLEVVEEAYAQPKPATSHHLATPNLRSSQGYMDPAPIGVDAEYARELAGGKGSGIKVVDVEGGWQTTHEDFPTLFSNSGNFNVTRAEMWNDHGTAVLGVMAAVDNGIGVAGMIDEAKFGVQSTFTQYVVEDPPGTFGIRDKDDLPNAIMKAAHTAGVGGVVLIEVHYPGPTKGQDCNPKQNAQCHHVPAENWPDRFHAIQYATAAGIIVVEAAGNGSMNLDHSVYENRYDRSFQDSGAILVGASQSDERTPMYFSNYGSRVDVHAWGENVTTLGYGDLFDGGHKDRDRFYTDSFSGTSSASPIVTSAAASLQGIAIAAGLEPFDSVGMRSLLSSTSIPQTGDLSKHIGGLPNIRAAYYTLSLTNTAFIQGSSHPDDIRVHAEPSSDGLNTVTVHGSSNHPDGTVLKEIDRIMVDTYAGDDKVEFDVKSQDVRIDLNYNGGENATSAKVAFQTPVGSEHAFVGLNFNAESIEMDIQNQSRSLEADVAFDVSGGDGSVKITSETALDTGVTSMNFIGAGGTGNDILEVLELGPGEFEHSGSINVEKVKFSVKGNATLVGDIIPLVDALECEYTVDGDLQVVGSATIGCDKAKLVVEGVIAPPAGLIINANVCVVENEAVLVCEPR